VNLRRGGTQVRRILIALTTAAVLVIGAVAAHLATTSDSTATSARRHARQAAPTEITSGPRPTAAPVRLDELRASSEPEEFANLVAHTLFGWDTTDGRSVEAYVNGLVAIADPTGEETPGLVADLAAYLPSPAAWSALREYSTRQWIVIDSLTVPSLWPRAVAEAPPGTLLAGTAAFTVRGVRHRAGVWEGRTVTTEHPVAFTIFVVCAPSYAVCRLLRLSRLDEPLS